MMRWRSAMGRSYMADSRTIPNKSSVRARASSRRLCNSWRMRTAVATAPMAFAPSFDAASAGRMRQKSTSGGVGALLCSLREMGLSTEMSEKSTELAGILIEFRGVSFQRNDILPARHVISDITLSISEGETVVLLGRSGSGKTTLLRLIYGMLVPTRGQVLVQGRATTEWDAIRLRRGIGYVIQEAGLFPHFTVAENVA